MACSSTVGTIKREHTDGAAYSSQQFCHLNNQGLHEEVKRELSPAPSLTVQVCPINVVQGDSILVKLKDKGMFRHNLMLMTVYWHSVINSDKTGIKTTALNKLKK